MKLHGSAPCAAARVLVASLILSACVAPAETRPPAQAAGPVGTATIAVSELGPESWIPRLTTRAHQVTLLFGDPLIGANPKTRELEPRLAESWKVDVGPNETVWTFKLRPNVPFNEGQGVVTAEDVKFTWSLNIGPDMAGGDYLGPLIDNDIRNFEVVGPFEFKLHQKKLNVSVPETLSIIQGAPVFIIPKAYYESVGESGWQAHPIGSGPYVFKSHAKGDRIVLEAVPNHWRKTANVKTLIFLIVPEASTRLAMLKTGQVDIAPLPSRFKKELSSDLKTFSVPNAGLVSVPLGGMYPGEEKKNCLPPRCPWNGIGGDPLKVREAMTIAIDRQGIVDRLLFGEGTQAPAPWVWSPGPFQYNDPSWTVPKYDPQRAKQLLAEAGYPNGFPIKLAIYANVRLPENEDVGEAVAGYWEAIGIKVERSYTEFAPTFRKLWGDRDLAGYAWINNVVFQDEPIRNLTPSHSKGSRTLVFFYDPKIDTYLDTAPQEPNIEKRMAMARELGAHIVKQRLMIPLFSYSALFVASSRVVSWEIIQGYVSFMPFETLVLAR